MRRENVAVADVAHFAELRYVRQSYELEVALQMGPLTRDAIDAAAAEFHRQHERVYGFCLPNAAVELVTLRTVHTAHLAKPELSQGASVGAGGTVNPIGSRDAYFEETGRYEPVPIFDRTSLGIGQEVEGPAILEQPDTTTVVYPGQSIRVDEAGNVILTVGSSPESERVREVGDVA
jgi:N-methylhydantoinase A